MRKMTARQLKNETGLALDWAAGGERVLITRRGQPVAWLIQAAPTALDEVDDVDGEWKAIVDAVQAEPPAFTDWQSASQWFRGRP